MQFNVNSRKAATGTFFQSGAAWVDNLIKFLIKNIIIIIIKILKKLTVWK